MRSRRGSQSVQIVTTFKNRYQLPTCVRAGDFQHRGREIGEVLIG